MAIAIAWSATSSSQYPETLVAQTPAAASAARSRWSKPVDGVATTRSAGRPGHLLPADGELGTGDEADHVVGRGNGVVLLDRDTEPLARAFHLEHVAPRVDQDDPAGHGTTAAKRSGDRAGSHSPETRLSAIAAVAPGPHVMPWALCPQHR